MKLGSFSAKSFFFGRSSDGPKQAAGDATGEVMLMLAVAPARRTALRADVAIKRFMVGSAGRYRAE